MTKHVDGTVDRRRADRRGMGWGLVVSVLALLVVGCASSAPEDTVRGGEPPGVDAEPGELEGAGAEAEAETEVPPPAVVAEAWETVRRPEENVGSVAVWPGAGDRAWLIATARATDRLLIYDAGTGEQLRDFGGRGETDGRFRRPHGVAVVDDLAFVVERGNARVQVLRLPGLSTVGYVGAGALEYPSGLAVFRSPGSGPRAYQVYVTDNDPRPPDDPALGTDGGEGSPEPPPPADLTRRVHHYRLRVTGETLSTEAPLLFGEAEGVGALHEVETIFADPGYRPAVEGGGAAGDAGAGRLLVAEASEARMGLRDYRLDGRFAAQVVEGFVSEPEGLALYPCADGDGYWIATEQGDERKEFRVLDRRTLEPLGRFTGELTANTGGIWLATVPTPEFPAGALYAVHDDQSVTAFDWRDVAAALALRSDCAGDGK